jgi:hypothetical protein
MSKDLIAAITLEAMARDYADGNLWDDLDREAVCEAARVIREQEAEIERLHKKIAAYQGPNQGIEGLGAAYGSAASHLSPAPDYDNPAPPNDKLRAVYAEGKSRLSPAPVSDGWRTLDDPALDQIKKDGTIIILTTGHSTGTGRWRRIAVRDTLNDYDDGSGMCATFASTYGWHSVSDKNLCSAPPTHWMPLPPLPTKAKD